MDREKKARIARQNKRRSKQDQTKSAQMMGMENVAGLAGEDARSHCFSGEWKCLKRFAGEKYLEQAEKNCPEGKIPLVKVHIVGERREDDILMFRFRHWQKVCRPELYSPPREPSRKEVTKEVKFNEQPKTQLKLIRKG